MKSAYHQCELDESSQAIATFLTQWGFVINDWYLELIMFLNFFKRLCLSTCCNVVYYIDDILVHGSTEKIHDECLTAVMTVLEEHNVCLNMSEVTFLGHGLSSRGVHPIHDKVIPIQQFRAPATKEELRLELRSFLGLVCSVARFIPDLATETNALRQLMK